jgi:hypothetical protein
LQKQSSDLHLAGILSHIERGPGAARGPVEISAGRDQRCDRVNFPVLRRCDQGCAAVSRGRVYGCPLGQQGLYLRGFALRRSDNEWCESARIANVSGCDMQSGLGNNASGEERESQNQDPNERSRVQDGAK